MSTTRTEGEAGFSKSSAANNRIGGMKNRDKERWFRRNNRISVFLFDSRGSPGSMGNTILKTQRNGKKFPYFGRLLNF